MCLELNAIINAISYTYYFLFPIESKGTDPRISHTSGKRGHTYAVVDELLVVEVMPEMLVTVLSVVVLDFLLSLISVRDKDVRLFFVGTTA